MRTKPLSRSSREQKHVPEQYTHTPYRTSDGDRLSPDILGRTFNGIGQPIDGLGEITPEVSLNINGLPLNPVKREYPRNYINTGISAIDGLTTLIRGQKLPIFSGNGLPHDQLAAQIVHAGFPRRDNSDEKLRRRLRSHGRQIRCRRVFRAHLPQRAALLDHVAMFINLANDPVVERLLTPKVALTAAEYLAFEKGMHILVILTDITSFCRSAMREVSSSKGEIPSRKGYPGYLYSDLATLYERAGIVAGRSPDPSHRSRSSPCRTMTSPTRSRTLPDTSPKARSFWTVSLHGQAIYPPISVLPSLSRLMKDGIGEGFTREDHQDVANQLFSCYAKVGDARALASVIGEDELSPIDKRYLEFGTGSFRGTSSSDSPITMKTAPSSEHVDNIGWELLGLLPKDELDRIDTKILNKYYKETVR